MPFPVKNLIEGHSHPVTVYKEDPLIKAHNQMITYDYSQLPVIDADSRPIGMVTSEGILRGVHNFKTHIEELRVRDVMRPATGFNLEDDLFDLLEQLKQSNAVLIVDSAGMLAGIVTGYDSTEYFRKRSENMMRVEDIEAFIKDFILLIYTGEDGSRDEAKLAQAITQVTPKEEGTSKPPKTFDELTLGQYVSLITSKSNWPILEPIFRIPRPALTKLLDGVRNTRNELAHFRGEITADQANQLRYCADWLKRIWEEYLELNKTGVVEKLFEPSELHAKQPALIREENAEYSSQAQPLRAADFGDMQTGRIVQIIAEESRPQESRYAPLIDYLQSQPGRIDEVKLSFEEIETIIGGALPASAYNYRVWWANDAVGHPHSQLWLEAGWRTTYVNLKAKTVPFARIREREKAYIDFFSKLLDELRKKVDFPVRQPSPDGTSWVVCQAIAPTGFMVGQFNYSFTRGRQFRVELYLDAFEQKPTKEIFDRLYIQREAVEGALGKVSWERIDNKRASRIAIYHPGSITDSKEQLETLREWGISTMIAFYNTLEPIATKAALDVLKA